jgi:hypothetical protein
MNSDNNQQGDKSADQGQQQGQSDDKTRQPVTPDANEPAQPQQEEGPKKQEGESSSPS